MDSSMVKIGPVGAAKEDAGDPWDDKHTDVVQIFIRYGSSGIFSIQFEYVDKDGSLVMSERHGCPGNHSILAVVKFSQKPKEFITRIGGYYNSCGVKTLEFETNIGTYGPFGNWSSHITSFTGVLFQNRQELFGWISRHSLKSFVLSWSSS